MKRRIALGYFAVSIAAVLLGFGLDRISLFTYFLWIFLGPISFLGFAAIAYRLLPVATEMVTYHTEMVTYYAVATPILGGLLWFMPRQYTGNVPAG